MILAGDVGGTKTNLALCDDHGAPVREATFAATDFASLEAMVARFVAGERITAACFGVAGPVDTDHGSAKITNLPWTIRADTLAKELAGARVELINDLQATALGALVIPASSVAIVQPGDVPAGSTIAVIAPGTGLGEAVLYHDGTRYQALPSEGGHADFAPTTDDEIELWRFLRDKYGGHVSVERVLSGNGIADLYDFCARASAKAYAGDRNAAISDAGLAGSDPCAVRALQLFAQILGAEAGNMALRALATGGVVIGGGIPPKILPALVRGELLARLCDKGRFAPWLRTLSVRVVLDPKAALLGAAHHAATTKDYR
ncbi:MAG TPA: glucokinase [Kofleriaceae bacterium]